MQLFSIEDHVRLADLFEPEAHYAGFNPAVHEAPNGDGKVDYQKRYLHIALKYNPPDWAVRYLARAHFEACRIAEALQVPAEFYPRVADGTLRVLEYAPGVGGHQHTDFDLFTVSCYRSDPTALCVLYDTQKTVNDLAKGRCIDTQLHIGELGELIGMAPATPHYIEPRPYWQYSMVYFAMPAMDAVLPGRRVLLGDGTETRWKGATVGNWLAERKSRSRV